MHAMTEEPTTATPMRRFRTTSFALKLAAIICMTANHAVWILGDHMSRGVMYALFGLGGATFPIMAFMLVEGFRHTSNIKRYAGRLALWAVIAEVPFYIFLASPEDFLIFNVLFTLLMSLGLLWLRENSRGPAFWFFFVVIVLASSFCDWGVIGPVIVMAYYWSGAGPQEGGRRGILLTLLIPLAYTLINTGVWIADYLQMGIDFWRIFVAMLPNIMYGVVGTGIAALLLYFYDGTLGKPLARGSHKYKFNLNTLVKWGFYAYYPLHIAVLGLFASLL